MGFFTNAFSTAGDLWFLWLPILLVAVLFDAWHSYARNCFKARVAWELLEVRIPREIERGPRAMEQLFAALHSTRNAPSKWVEMYWEGEMTLWYSFEIVSISGEIHFYIRTPRRFRDILEANLYAYYPDIEIALAKDYIDRMPSTVQGFYDMGYQIWATELGLANEDAYPIRTHREFETMDDFNKVDPIAILLEILGRLDVREQLWVQILIGAASQEWKERGKKLVQKLKEEGKENVPLVTGEPGKMRTQLKIIERTPGQVDIIKAIEQNIAKPGFQTTIRYLYTGPKDIFQTDIPWRGVLGAFNQFTSQSLNYFQPRVETRTAVRWFYWPYIYPKRRLERRKRLMLRRYRERIVRESTLWTFMSTGSSLAPSIPVLNTEELATIYHYPSKLVLTAPIIQSVESKKIGPPAGLPIFGDEKEGEEPLAGFKQNL